MDLVSFLIGFFSGALILAVVFATVLWQKIKPLFAVSDEIQQMDDLLEEPLESKPIEMEPDDVKPFEEEDENERQ